VTIQEGKMIMLQTAVMFDMRAPLFGTPAPELYAAALDMAAFADQIGISFIGLMEHHGADDGYLPSPFVMGGAIAARTRRCRIALGAVILPLHDPVNVAEDIAVLDQLSGGRLQVVFGAGYVPSEFARFRVSLRDRGRLLDEGIDLILRALHGERFEANGREIFVRPLPARDPQDILLVGGSVAASANRAARFDLGFAPVFGGLFPLYEEECRLRGHPPRYCHGPASPLSIHLAADVDQGWSRIKAHALHVVKAYAQWAEEEEGANPSGPFHGLHDEAALRASGIFTVWTPEELLTRAEAADQHVTLGFMPLLGGLDPAVGWESLRLLEKVMPDLQAIQQARLSRS
jgi:alkanesulfonate monooxygenase SsuD/methylene tetrahydromethanopterin reductase-like flavin-dependent oxidoreductase (luciferase family)